MKILGWMQCMLRNKSAALLKEPHTGLIKDSRHGNGTSLLLNPSWTNQQDYSWSKNGPRCRSKSRNDDFDGEYNLDEATQDTFPGFLTIGTLNMESITSTEPTTPTFGFPSDEEENEGRQMSYDLKLINDELQRFLKSEGENEGFNESTRTSVASTITLSGKETDDNEGKGEFPLQGYLFASSYDLSVLEEEATKERASLLELFRRSRVDNSSCIKLDMIEEDQPLEKHKAPMHPMKRIIQTFQPKKKEVLRDGGGSTQSSPTSKRFRKIKKLFQRKVHPEGHVVAEESNKFRKCMRGKTLPGNMNNNNNERFMVSGHGSGNSNPKSKSTNIKDEHWIRTDEDYLVLELGQE